MQKNIIVKKNYDIILSQPKQENIYNRTYLKILTDPYLIIFNTLPRRLKEMFPDMNISEKYNQKITEHEFIFSITIKYYLIVKELGIFPPNNRNSTISFYTSRFVWLEVFLYWNYLQKSNCNFDLHIVDDSLDPSTNIYTKKYIEKFKNKYKTDINIINKHIKSFNELIYDNNKKSDIVVIEILKINNEYLGLIDYYYLQPYYYFLIALKKLKKGGNCFISFRIPQMDLLYQFTMIGKKYFEKAELRDFNEKYISYVNLVLINYKSEIPDKDLDFLLDILKEWNHINPHGETTLNYSDEILNEKYSLLPFDKTLHTDKFVTSILSFKNNNAELWNQVYDIFTTFKKKIIYLDSLTKLVNEYLKLDKDIIMFDIINLQYELFISQIVQYLINNDIRIKNQPLEIYHKHTHQLIKNTVSMRPISITLSLIDSSHQNDKYTETYKNIHKNEKTLYNGLDNIKNVIRYYIEYNGTKKYNLSDLNAKPNTSKLNYQKNLLGIMNICVDMRGNMSMGNLKIYNKLEEINIENAIHKYINEKYQINISNNFVQILNILHEYSINIHDNYRVYCNDNTLEYQKGVHYFLKKNKINNIQFIKGGNDLYISKLTKINNSVFVYLTKYDMQGVTIHNYIDLEKDYTSQNILNINESIKLLNKGGTAIFELGGIITTPESIEMIKLLQKNFGGVYFYGNLHNQLYIVAIDKLNYNSGVIIDDKLLINQIYRIMEIYINDYINILIQVFSYLDIDGIYEKYSNIILTEKIKYSELWIKNILDGKIMKEWLIENIN